jgi:ABC-2 type transport system permease protein
MSAPYDPASQRVARFTRLDSVPLQPVGSTADGTGIAAVLKVFRHRQMLDLLIRRDLKSRYKDSSLGFVWTLIRPLTQLVIYYVVLGQFLGAARGIDDFAVYIYSGLTIYGLFSEIVLGGVGSIVSNAGLVKKVYLPREVFALASVGAALFNFLIQLGVLVAATLVTGSLIFDADLLYALPSLLLVVVYGTAFALLLGAVNVYLRDTQYLAEVIMMFLMWASPIVYTWTMARDIMGPGPLLEVYTNNPITLAVLGFHKAFWGSGGDEPYPADLLLRMLVALVVGLVVLVICHGVFRRLQGNFAQEL